MDLLQFTSDYIDLACQKRVGHDNWGMLNSKQLKAVELMLGHEIAEVIVFYKNEDEYDDN